MNFQPEKTLGGRIRQLREALALSQADLAARLPGVKQQSIDQVERGLVARPRFLPELAEALDTTVAWLLTGEGPPDRAPPRSDQKVNIDIDTELLRDVLLAVESVLAAQRLELEVKHRAQLIGALYELMRTQEKRNAEMLAQAAANIINYDQLMRYGRKN
jgi:transcriptional regulator with XRE-family HTH domain